MLVVITTANAACGIGVGMGNYESIATGGAIIKDTKQIYLEISEQEK